jgi:hypothetical protein
VRGRLEQKVDHIATLASHITEANAKALGVDPSNLDTWQTWNIVTDIANALMEEDVESVMDRLVALQEEIANENDVNIVTEEG